MSGEPQTEAGRMFAADPYDTPNPQRRLDYILAIEREAIAQERERLAAVVPADPWYSPDLGTGSSQPDDECYYCLTPKPDHGPDCWWVALREALQGADR